MGFDVEYVAAIKWPPIEKNPMDALIMEDSDKDVLRALTRKYAQDQAAWGADFTEGKGERQIFLLHGRSSKMISRGLLITFKGPPGTGKTFTVGEQVSFSLIRMTYQANFQNALQNTPEDHCYASQ